MKKKNGKGKKKKIVGIVCLVFVVLFAGTLVSAYSMFKTRFYDKSNYVKKGTYVAAAYKEKKTDEGEKDTAELSEKTSEEATHSTIAARKIHSESHSTKVVTTSSSQPETEESSSSISLQSRQRAVSQETTETEENILTRLAKQFFSKKDT